LLLYLSVALDRIASEPEIASEQPEAGACSTPPERVE
jgi:hypothetical protein